MRTMHTLGRMGCAAGLLLASASHAATPAPHAGLALAPSVLAGVVGSPVTASLDPVDRIVFKSGRVVEGEILSENENEVRIRVTIAGITSETTYRKDDIISITRGERTGDAKGADPAKPPAKSAVTAAAPAQRTGRPLIYITELKGVFGESISQTPLRQVVADAKSIQPEYMVFVLDNDWSFGGFEQAADDESRGWEVFRMEQMAPIFTDEIKHQWGEGNPPRIVFWVKQAMGGSAVLPFAGESIYMAPGARIGGLGNLTQLLGQRGSERTREKLYSAYLSMAKSVAASGGYDTRIIRALCDKSYVLSYKLVGGKPVYLERFAESPDEFLLTDDGDEQAGRKDTDEQIVRGLGNDTLTLTAELAGKLGLSRGTVSSLESLLISMGVDRTHDIVRDSSDRIMTGWVRSVDNAKREIRSTMEDFAAIQVQGNTARERNRQRAAQIAKLKQVAAVTRRYGESIPDQWFGRYDFPGNAESLPSWCDTVIEQIRLQMLADRD